MYYIDFSNMINSRKQGTDTVFYNGGGVVYRGVEAEGTSYLGGGFSVFANGSINRAKYAGSSLSGLWIPNAPDWTGAVGAIYNLQGWYASVMEKWVGKTYSGTYTDANNVAHDLYPIGSYGIMHVSLGYTVPSDAFFLANASIKLQIGNVLDKTSIDALAGYAGTSDPNLDPTVDPNGTPLWWTIPARSVFDGNRPVVILLAETGLRPFQRDATRFAAGQGAALARCAPGRHHRRPCARGRQGPATVAPSPAHEAVPIMTAAQWGGASAIFLASAVEWVEAFTIVLAVALTIGWRRATGAAATALALIAILIAVTGFSLTAAQADIDRIRAAIGIFLLLFGLRWYVKAIRRFAGRTALHDEAQEFAETREHLERAEGRAAWVIAFKGVLLEGLEVWLLVVALGHTLSYPAAAGSAVAALVAVIGVGLALQAPLTRVPENTLKFMVSCAILSFGSFWSLGGIVGEQAAWPPGDITLLLLFAAYALAGRIIARAARVPGSEGALGARA